MQYRKSNRLKNWDYSENGFYFITICIKERRCLFGDLMDGEMILSEYGRIAKKCWEDIPGHYEKVELDVFVIMPNHIHGIVSIVRTGRHACPLRNRSATQYSILSNVIGSYKSAVTRQINRSNKDLGFEWQRSFHDHIVRTDYSLDKICRYIINNPLKWDLDKQNPAVKYNDR
jgi:REP element-mobilizing transposase RayT